MSEDTILIIDDSSTIRRLVDRCLTAAGYRVVAAPTAEEGVQLAGAESPDLILLDHQLPGTTGTEVASQLLEVPEARRVPVVVSSTLRKKAYAEYMELPNVVDMLPKPYTEELLITTVENALSTAKMVVDSQADGTAVPEVLQAGNEPILSGRLGTFGVREVLDFLNNTKKNGLLEVEGDGCRVFFTLANGRIDGVSASGISADDVVKRLPPSLQNLAPVVKLTIGGRGGSEFDGLVELLNRKVVDPRLLRKLLRHQASVLAWKCFTSELREFRFTEGCPLPPLVTKLPLEISVLALLIEGSLVCDPADLPADEDEYGYVRRAIRGQNLDRAGIAAQYMKALNGLSERQTAVEVADQIGCPVDEARRFLFAMARADLVDRVKESTRHSIVVYQPDPVLAGQLRKQLSTEESPYDGKVVRDPLALQLVLRRSQPDAFVIDLSTDEAFEVLKQQQAALGADRQTKWLAVTADDPEVEQSCRQRLGSAGLHIDELLTAPGDMQTIEDSLARVFSADGARETPERTLAPTAAV